MKLKFVLLKAMATIGLAFPAPTPQEHSASPAEQEFTRTLTRRDEPDFTRAPGAPYFEWVDTDKASELTPPPKAHKARADASTSKSHKPWPSNWFHPPPPHWASKPTIVTSPRHGPPQHTQGAPPPARRQEVIPTPALPDDLEDFPLPPKSHKPVPSIWSHPPPPHPKPKPTIVTTPRLRLPPQQTTPALSPAKRQEEGFDQVPYFELTVESPRPHKTSTAKTVRPQPTTYWQHAAAETKRGSPLQDATPTPTPIPDDLEDFSEVINDTPDAERRVIPSNKPGGIASLFPLHDPSKPKPTVSAPPNKLPPQHVKPTTPPTPARRTAGEDEAEVPEDLEDFAEVINDWRALPSLRPFMSSFLHLGPGKPKQTVPPWSVKPVPHPNPTPPARRMVDVEDEAEVPEDLEDFPEVFNNTPDVKRDGVEDMED